MKQRNIAPIVSIYSPVGTDSALGSVKFGSYDPIAIANSGSLNIMKTLPNKDWVIDLINA